MLFTSRYTRDISSFELYVLPANTSGFLKAYSLDHFNSANQDYILEGDIVIDAADFDGDFLLFNGKEFSGKIFNPYGKIITIKNPGKASALISSISETGILDGLIVHWEDAVYDGQGSLSGIAEKNEGLINNCSVSGNFTSHTFSGITYTNDGVIIDCNTNFTFTNIRLRYSDPIMAKKADVGGIATYNTNLIISSNVRLKAQHANVGYISLFPHANSREHDNTLFSG